MPMSDEAASAALSAAQRSMEITAEIIKVIAPAIPKLFKGALDVTKSVEDLVSVMEIIVRLSFLNATK